MMEANATLARQAEGLMLHMDKTSRTGYRGVVRRGQQFEAAYGSVIGQMTRQPSPNSRASSVSIR